MNRVFKNMRKAHEKQAKAICRKAAYKKISDEFDVEYKVAVELHNARERAQLTQTQLAERMGTTQSVVSRIERGVNVSLETLARYANACGAKLDVRIL